MYRTDFWTLWEKTSVGWSERTALKHVYYQVWNRSPVQVGCMRQVLGAGALGWPRGMGWRRRWERGSGWGTHVNPRLIHVNVWQKPLQYCKVISLQLIKINGKKKPLKNLCPNLPICYLCVTFLHYQVSEYNILNWYFLEFTVDILLINEKEKWFGHRFLVAISWEGNGIPLQCSCLENSMVNGAWQALMESQRVRHNWVTITHSLLVDCEGLWQWKYTDSIWQ